MKPYIKILIASFLVIFACLGFGRFAFGMVIPNMQESLQITTTEIGFISSANFIGYITGILLVSYFYSKFTTYKLIFLSLFLQGFMMLCMTINSNYLIISIFYAFSGFCAAIANISIMAHITNVVPKNIRGKILGIVVSGSGLAIILSGLIVPYIETLISNSPWKISWSIFSLLIILVAFFSQPGIKKHASHDMPENKIKIKEYFIIPNFWKITSIYMIFGVSYIIYMTFFVSAVIDKYNFSSTLSGNFWAILGAMSLFSGLIFGIIADKIGAYKTLIFVFILQTISHLILGFDCKSWMIWFSAILFGISVWSIPSLVTLLISFHFDIRRTAQVLSVSTLLFAFCQAIAPVGAGFMYDLSKDFSYIFLLTSILTFIAIILCLIFSKQKIKQIH